MRWTIKNVSLLCSLFFVAIIAVILVGQQQPPSIWSTILRLNQCELPCWIGIIPGKTTLKEAQEQIEQAYSYPSFYSLKQNESSFNIVYRVTGYRFGIAFETGALMNETPQSVIQNIYLLPDLPSGAEGKNPTVPDLYDALGNPEIVRLISGGEREGIELLFKGQQVGIRIADLDCDKITMKQVVESIELFAQPPSEHSFAWLSKPQQWGGFGKCYRFVRSIAS